MNRRLCLAAVAAVMSLAGCAGPGYYPISRAKAGPTDPVLSLAVPFVPGH